MENPPVHINKWLLPFSWLYGFVVSIRNKFFDWGIFKQEEFDVPVICIGNITVGGTGKTPHTEYLVHLLKKQYRIGVLSRGYKRKTSGFLLATDTTTSKEIGDEPFQIKQKFPDIIVAVDEKRRRGIKQLLSLQCPPEVILLDDAFQHRYVKPSYTIVLSDYNRPVYEDKLLPAGRLRESTKALRKRADMVIVTKCPNEIQPIDFRIISHHMNLFPYQGLFFTTFGYQGLRSVFTDEEAILPLESLSGKHILLVTGIASPKTIQEKLSEYTKTVETIAYPDHHDFSTKDINHITEAFRNIKSDNKLILITEKDASRLILFKDQIDEDVKQCLYYLPIEVVFIDNDQEKFNRNILKHLRAATKIWLR
ncbi:MAG: tetraacyldisaccharide 4'-kinase [Prevotella sp.]|nr:tetraacyldisaccharide 4'-kinase [Prevotella sp.]